jgi:hypothetical protein
LPFLETFAERERASAPEVTTIHPSRTIGVMAL